MYERTYGVTGPRRWVRAEAIGLTMNTSIVSPMVSLLTYLFHSSLLLKQTQKHGHQITLNWCKKYVGDTSEAQIKNKKSSSCSLNVIMCSLSSMYALRMGIIAGPSKTARSGTNEGAGVPQWDAFNSLWRLFACEAVTAEALSDVTLVLWADALRVMLHEG